MAVPILTAHIPRTSSSPHMLQYLKCYFFTNSVGLACLIHSVSTCYYYLFFFGQECLEHLHLV